ncbi:hypothetical protein C3L33_17393, partial [Rhododendron williamsianum]
MHGKKINPKCIVYLEAYILNLVSVFSPSRSRLCVKNLPKNVNEKRLREFFSQKGEVTDAKIMRTKDGNSRQFGFVGYRTEGEAEEAVKYFNNSYLDTSRVVCESKEKWSDSEKSDDEDNNDNSGKDGGKSKLLKMCREHQDIQKIDPKVQRNALEIEASERRSKRAFLKTPSMSEEELEEHFRKLGNVSQVHLVIDKDTKRSKGIAYVAYTLPESAARIVHYLITKEVAIDCWLGVDTGGEKAVFVLFMVVVENIAREFGISKSDVLDREADDLPVRIALGETKVIAETKKALVNAGVNKASLEELAIGKPDGVRKRPVILVKNLPYGCSEDELDKMFRKFGSLDKIILPRTRTLALVVFLEPSEARAAFKAKAYKCFNFVEGFNMYNRRGTPLYLEWAPGDILIQNSKILENTNNAVVVGEHQAKRVLLEQHVEGIVDADVDPDRIEVLSIHILFV